MPDRLEDTGTEPRPTYSVSIAGDLGPVLQASFAEFHTVVTSVSTVFQVRLPADHQLSEIGSMLEARGLRLVSLRLLPEAPAGSAHGRKVA